MITLWSINRRLRWLGFVLIVQADGRPPDDPDRYPTRIGFQWIGWPPERKWAEYCERAREREAKPIEASDLGPTPGAGT